MKNIIIQLIVAFLLLSCGNSTSNPSIKDNSVHKVAEEKTDYSTMEPSKLLKHIQAHYDLGQYQMGKEKLKALMIDYPDSLDGVNLAELKLKIDKSLKEEQLVKQAMAQAEIKKRLPSSMDRMRILKDSKTTYYFDKSSPEFDTKECFYAYVKKGIYGAQLFFKVRYVGTTWIDMKQCMVTVDQLDYAIEGEVIKSETKGKKAYKHELIDIEITSDEQLETLKAIANGNNVLALLIGKDSYKKRVITKEQCVAIRNVLDAYTFMSEDKEEIFKKNVTDISN